MTAYEVITTPFIAILESNPINSQIYLKWILGVGSILQPTSTMLLKSDWLILCSEAELIKNNIKSLTEILDLPQSYFHLSTPKVNQSKSGNYHYPKNYLSGGHCRISRNDIEGL
jgi:hypothetical protein